ncbi:putative oxidoreductase OrdL [Smittium mucronatum]|uniref:Putative oxidoreductase OrdL n=1 Tax=Smittium mucronatum TaxID=133383 RepID=A0A1R0GR41_9FUNG|nr:putative oxidoreductase OrdL [Smittium mucronatum]
MHPFDLDPGLPSENPTRSGWLDENPLKNYRHSEELPTFSDILIIGSGFSGSSVAYHLLSDPRTKLNDVNPFSENSDPKKKLVTLLEAREACGGATGRNGGHLIPANYRDFIDDSKVFGSEEQAAAVRIFEQIGANEVKDFIVNNKVECEFRSEGNLQLYTSQEDFENALKNLEAVRSWGIGGQQVYSQQDLKKIFGATECVGGIKIPGSQVFPAKLIWFLLSKAIESGLNLYTHTPVEKVSLATPQDIRLLEKSVESSKLTAPLWCVTTSTGKKVFTNKVVHATNAYASHILEDYRAHVFPVRAQIISPAAEHCTNLWPFGLSLRHGLEYAIQRDYPNGRLVLGGRRTSSPTLEVGTADDSVLSPELCQALREDLKKAEFGYMGLNPESLYNVREWTGIMGFSDDNVPYVGKVVTRSGNTLEGQYILAGFTGHGMPKCFRCGREIARLISESYMTPSELSLAKSNSHNVDPTSISRLAEMSKICYTPSPNTVRSEIWNTVGESNIDSWDYPLLKCMEPSKSRMEKISTESWGYRTLLAPKSKL